MATRPELERRVPSGKSGCAGCLTSTIVVPLFAFVLAAPLAFHLGGHWTLLGRWTGVGTISDSAGARYGLYLWFEAYPNLDFRNQATSCCELSGKAQVCTAGGARYPFDVDGRISGAWLRTEGAKVSFSLTESGHPKLPRSFQLSGVWRGPNLVLDDEKSMFMNFLPGGNLTPSPTYTSPVPEKHAKVEVSPGSLNDLDLICTGIRNSSRDPHQ